MKRVLITGGTGFIGSNLALELQRQGMEVMVTGNEAEQKLPGIRCFTPTFFGVDHRRIGKIDYLFHQAALNDTTNLDHDEMRFANYGASKDLFKWAIENGCKRIVYASSTAVYGDVPAPYRELGPVNPLNPYGKSKLDIDEFVRKVVSKHPDVRIVGLRYCNVYGPRESHKGHRASMVYQLAQQMVRGPPRIFEWGDQKRDFIYVADVVRANIMAAKADSSCIVNCGSGQAYTFNEIIGCLNGVLGTDHKPVYIKNPYENFYQNHTECDMSLAKEKIGFVPKYDIKGGIRAYYDSGFLVKP